MCAWWWSWEVMSVSAFTAVPRPSPGARRVRPCRTSCSKHGDGARVWLLVGCSGRGPAVGAESCDATVAPVPGAARSQNRGVCGGRCFSHPRIHPPQIPHGGILETRGPPSSLPDRSRTGPKAPGTVTSRRGPLHHAVHTARPPRGPALKSPSQGAAPWELVKNTLDVRHESPPDPVHRFVPLSQRGLPGRRPSTDTGGSSFPRGTPQRLSRRPVGPAARLPGSLLEGKRADLDEHRRGEGLHSPPPPGCPSCPLGQQEDLPVLLKSRTVPWQQGRGTTDSSSVSPPHREEPKRPGTASPRVVCSPVGRWPKILKLVASPSPNGIGPLPSVS